MSSFRPKYQRKNLTISALAPKLWARAEIVKFFRWYFGRNDDTQNLDEETRTAVKEWVENTNEQPQDLMVDKTFIGGFEWPSVLHLNFYHSDDLFRQRNCIMRAMSRLVILQCYFECWYGSGLTFKYTLKFANWPNNYYLHNWLSRLSRLIFIIRNIFSHRSVYSSLFFHLWNFHQTVNSANLKMG